MSRASSSAVAERPRSHPRRHAASATSADSEPRGRLRGSPGGGGGNRGGFSGGPRPVWSGSISFGLVNIPVRLFTAVREHRVAFHLLHDQDKVRLRRKVVSSVTGREIHPEHIVRGSDVGDNRYIIVSQDELEGCAPEKTKAIEITDCVTLSEIDPVYYERAYAVLPKKATAAIDRLIVEAMNRAKRRRTARLVILVKDYRAALRPLGELICLTTMHRSDEVVSLELIEESFAEVQP